MTPKLKFVIYEQNVCPDGVLVKEPLGWKDIQLVLERHPKYYSLIEYFQGEFIWYGDARTIFNQIETESGPDAIVSLIVSISYQRGVWEELFTGLIDLSMLEELTKQTRPYKIKAPIIRNDTWAKFINRKETPVDLLSETSLDGDVVTVEDKITLPLPSQIIQASYSSRPDNDFAAEWFGIPNNGYAAIQFSTVETDELKNIFNLGLGGISDLPAPFYVPKFGGDHAFEIAIHLGGVQAGRDVYIQLNDDAAILLTLTTVPDAFLGDHDLWSYTGTLSLSPNDSVRLYIKNTTGGSLDVSGYGYTLFQSYIRITGQTVYPDTTTDSILLKDAATNILRKIIGTDNVLQSTALDNYLGLYAIQKALHIRGYSMDDKPFTMSFDQWWEGASPALALGLGYDEDTGLIEIENIGHFFKISPSITFPAVGDITRQYGTDYLYKLIENGFKEWAAESDGGIDDIQTKKKYRLRGKISGKTLSNLSEFYAAALGIEQTRRNRAEQTKDWRLDEKICIVAVKETEGGYTPEVGTDFASVTGLNNSETRYNIRLAVSRIFKRWQPYYQGCLEYYDNEKFYFASGEGNYDASITLNPSDPEVRVEDSGGGIAENQDIEKGAENLILPNLYKVSNVPITWEQYKTIRDNKNNAIGVPYNQVNKSMYINRLAFKLMKGDFDADLLETSPTAFDNYMLYEDELIMAFEDGTLMKYE